MTPKPVTTYLSITTIAGKCPVNCKKYCPQELIWKNYSGNTRMTLQQLQRFTADIPRTTSMYIGGFSEPFMNPETVSMLEWLNQEGFNIRLFTTGVGLKKKDLDRVCMIPFDMFVLHEPDACGIAHIPYHKDYGWILWNLKTRIKNFRSMNMNPIDFETNHREDVARGEWFQAKFRLTRTCLFMKYPRYELMPNGEVYFCCECSCISMGIGNMNLTPYNELVKKHEEFVKEFRGNPKSICQNCCLSIPKWKDDITIFINKLKGEVPLKERPVLKQIWDIVMK